MPRKPTKSREQRTAEGFFRVDQSDLKYTTEKLVKEPLVAEILERTIEKPIKEISKEIGIKVNPEFITEKEYKKPSRGELEKVKRVYGKGKSTYPKKYPKKYGKSFSKSNSFSKIKTFEPEKISLRKDGYELIITEKPQAAMKIASALGRSEKKNFGSIPFYEVDRNGKTIFVACAVGHLFTLSQNTQGSSVPIFDISWKDFLQFRFKSDDFKECFIVGSTVSWNNFSFFNFFQAKNINNNA